jgi:predicted ATP-grasp superfamily ATP-dependent carboligase
LPQPPVLRGRGIRGLRMANILVTDGEQRAALAIVRSLGRAGHRCVVCSSSGRTLAGSSRYADREVQVPDPGSTPAENAAAIQSLARAEQVDIVIPVSEASLLAVLAVRDDIAATIPFPDLETFRTICNKKHVLAAADALGICVPRQWEILSASHALPADVDGPLVLKPARSVYTAADGSRGKVGVRWVHTKADMEAASGAYPAAAYPLLAQETIIGPGVGVFVLVHDGQCLARYSHLRVREKPPSGGVSVLRQSEPMDVELLDRSLALLSKLGWSGVAMVEYKRDAATSEPVLMEINGRFWGSLQLAIDAGVDFPRLLVDHALGVDVTPVENYRFIRSRWFWGDVDHLIARWRRPSVSWKDRTSSLLALIRACGPGYKEEVLRWSDPWPFLHESVNWIRDLSRTGVSP